MPCCCSISGCPVCLSWVNQTQDTGLLIRHALAGLENIYRPSHQFQRSASTLIRGNKVGEIYRDQKVVDVTVRGTERIRHDMGALSAAMIDTPFGARVPLGELADRQIVPTPNKIKRENASRRLDVMLDVVGIDLGSVAKG